MEGHVTMMKSYDLQATSSLLYLPNVIIMT